MYRCTLVHRPSVSSSKCIKTNKNSCLLYEIFKISQRGIKKAHQCFQMKIIFAFQFLWGGTNFVRPSAFCIRVSTVSYEFLQMQSIYMGHFVKSFSNIFFLGNGSIFLLHFLFFKLFGLFCWCHPKMSDKCVWSIGRFVMTNKKDACSKRPMDHVSSDQFQFWKRFPPLFLVIYNVIYSYRKSQIFCQF